MLTCTIDDGIKYSSMSLNVMSMWKKYINKHFIDSSRICQKYMKDMSKDMNLSTHVLMLIHSLDAVPS
jgi:hypothetical protein